MTKKEKQIYPRSRKEMLRIMKTAEKEGNLLETALEEFTMHPFSMPALWDCRDYIFRIERENYEKAPFLISLLALLSAMAGRLDEAKEYVDILGKTQGTGSCRILALTIFAGSARNWLCRIRKILCFCGLYSFW